jgi:hypothetical protein
MLVHFDPPPPKKKKIGFASGGLCKKSRVLSKIFRLRRAKINDATSTTKHVLLAKKSRFQIRQQNVYIWHHFRGKY